MGKRKTKRAASLRDGKKLLMIEYSICSGWLLFSQHATTHCSFINDFYMLAKDHAHP